VSVGLAVTCSSSSAEEPRKKAAIGTSSMIASDAIAHFILEPSSLRLSTLIRARLFSGTLRVPRDKVSTGLHAGVEDITIAQNSAVPLFSVAVQASSPSITSRQGLE
jgi:hypothetical protein